MAVSIRLDRVVLDVLGPWVVYWEAPVSASNAP
jgi:hypothetical protein